MRDQFSHPATLHGPEWRRVQKDKEWDRMEDCSGGLWDYHIRRACSDDRSNTFMRIFPCYFLFGCNRRYIHAYSLLFRRGSPAGDIVAPRRAALRCLSSGWVHHAMGSEQLCRKQLVSGSWFACAGECVGFIGLLRSVIEGCVVVMQGGRSRFGDVATSQPPPRVGCFSRGEHDGS